MPDFHQPDDEDRRNAAAAGDLGDTVGDWAEKVPLESLRDHAREVGIADADRLDKAELVDALKGRRPSSRNDPNAPDRPLT
jgi:hypothetical protein